jgi:hypothetical protein
MLAMALTDKAGRGAAPRSLSVPTNPDVGCSCAFCVISVHLCMPTTITTAEDCGVDEHFGVWDVGLPYKRAILIVEARTHIA